MNPQEQLRIDAKSRLRHIVGSYGGVPGVWLGIALTIAVNVILKGVLALIVARFAIAVVTGDPSALSLVGTLFLALGTAALLSLAGDYVFVYSTDRQYAQLVGQFYHSITSRSIWLIQSRKVDALRNVFRNHLDGTVGVVRIVRTDLIPFLCACGIPAIILGYFDWQIGLFVLFVVVLQVWFAIWAARYVSDLRKQALKVYNKLTLLLFEHLKRLDLMKVALALSDGRRQVEMLATEEAQLFWGRHRASFAFEFCKAMLAAVCFACVFWLIERRFSGTPLASSLVIVAAMYLLQSMQAAHSSADLVARFSEKWSQVGSSLSALGGDMTEPEPNRKEAVLPSATSRSIELCDVSFGYRMPTGVPAALVFNKLNLKIPAGDHVAIVGNNGSGKTTLLHLILRFDRVQSGSILVDGMDINSIKEESYFGGISYAPSGGALLSTTIRQNITLLNREASTERIEWAMDTTGVSDFLREKVAGLETNISEDGAGLSAGEQQRIVLARSLLREAQIYLFDEATGALDEDSSMHVATSIRQVLSGRTVIFVTHSKKVASLFPRTLECRNGSFVELTNPFPAVPL